MTGVGFGRRLFALGPWAAMSDWEDIVILAFAYGGAAAIGWQVYGWPGGIATILLLSWVESRRRKRKQEEAKARLRKELYGE